MDLKLKDKTATITGGSRGIGRAIKLALEKEGVIVTDYSRNWGYDLMEWTPEIIETDILINNLGGVGSNPEEWELAMQKNYNIMVKMTKAFLKHKRSFGRVITIASIHGLEKGPNPGFAAAKAAQIAYMKSMAGKVEGTTCNVICPGHIDVGKPFPDKPRIIGKPEDVAHMVVCLCSPKMSHVNGSIITVDGGESVTL